MPHQRVPRRTKAKPASERPPNRDGLLIHRSDGPQSQTAGPGDGRARRRRRRRVNDDDDDDDDVDDVVRKAVGKETDGDGRVVVIAAVERDDVGGAVAGAAVIGVERIGVGVPRGCPAPRSRPLFLLTGPHGLRRPSPSPAPGVGGLETTDSCYHYATLSHGEEVEVESVAGTRGRSAERAEGRDATRSRPAGTTGATSRSTSHRGCDGETAARQA